MITEVITFKLPEGMTREQVMENFRQSAPRWRANPDLIRKNYLYDGDKGHAGGVYLWRNMDGARRAHDDAWFERVRRSYGSEPVVQYFEAPIVVDNAIGDIIEAMAGG